MKTIVSKLAQFNAIDTLDAEVQFLLELARDRITPYDVASAMVGYHLNTPAVIRGTYPMDAGKQQQRNEATPKTGKVEVDVAWDDAFKVIAFNVVATHGYLEFNDFVNIATQWNANADNCSVTLEEATLKEYVKLMTGAMVRDGWIVKTPIEKTVMIPVDGKQVPVKRKVREATDAFNALYEEMAQDLSDDAQMVCAPMRHKPQPWTFNSEGKVVGIHPKANIRFNKGLSVPSQKTLDAINKDMGKPAKVHPAMINLAKFAVSNAQQFRELDECVATADTDEARREAQAKWEGQLRTWDAMRKLQPETDYYFPITGDHRMRQYYRGGVISPQGGNNCKAAFMDAEMPELGANGLYALYVGFATAIGIKGSVMDRLQHTRAMVENGTLKRQLDEHPINFLKLYAEEDKYQAYVIAHEIIAALEWSIKHGTTETYRCGVIIHQDGTCNGMQHMGIITRDRTTCENTNVAVMTHHDALKDIYGLVSEATGDLAKWGRNLTKNGTMVKGYGASDETVKRGVQEWLTKRGNDYHEQDGMAVVTAIDTTLPAIATVTKYIQMACEEILQAGGTDITMYAPDGFKQVQQYVYNAEAQLPLGSFATVKHTDGTMTLNCEQMITATPPNMIHMMDSCHVRYTILACDWKVFTVHDSFGTAPRHYFATNKILAEQLANLYTDFCPVRNLYEDYKIPFMDFASKMEADAITLDEVRQAVNAFS